MAKTTIDIEALLHWAYGVQRVDRFAAQAERDMAGPALASCDMTAVAALGVRVQASGRWLASMGATIADDAIAVHDAVLALDDMYCETKPNGDVRVWLPCEIADAGLVVRDTIHGLALLRVSGISGRIDWTNVSPVTKLVTSVLVIQHARNGDRPECYVEAKRPVGRLPSAGAAGARRRKGVDHSGPSWESVITARAEYHVWLCALTLLAKTLAPELVAHLVLPPSAPESPWSAIARRAKTPLNAQKVIAHN